jgi:predicted ATP-grasp superfamily ATP-dependent carboligase
VTASSPEPPGGVLVTNAEERSMLAACRSLSAAGYRVGAASFRKFAAAHGSRCCTYRVRVTDPELDAPRFIADLREELARHRYAVLLPGSDRALLAISHWREQLEGLALIGLPAPEIVARSLDREALARASVRAGLSPPESIRCTGPEEALRAAQALGFPAILKSLHAVELVDSTVRQAPPSRSVATEQHLTAALAEHLDTVLLQRAEHGTPFSFAGVIADGRLLAVAMAHYRRTWPPAAGNVAFAETIDPPAELQEAVQALMAEIGWEGIFELELIRTREGQFVPIDLNPRPYGSMALAVGAGAPLPAIWCEHLLGMEPRAVHSGTGSPIHAPAGVRYRWEDADLRHLAWQLRHGHLRAALQAARPHRRVVHAHFQLADPLPLLMRGLYIARARVRPHARASSTRARRMPP